MIFDEFIYLYITEKIESLQVLKFENSSLQVLKFENTVKVQESQKESQIAFEV